MDPKTEIQTLKPEMRPHLIYLGTALGYLHDAGLERNQIEFFVGMILDKIEEVKADPERLAKLAAGMAAVVGGKS